MRRNLQGSAPDFTATKPTRAVAGGANALANRIRRNRGATGGAGG